MANFQGELDQDLKLPLAFFVLIIAKAERIAPLWFVMFGYGEEMATHKIDDLVLDKRLLIDLVTN